MVSEGNSRLQPLSLNSADWVRPDNAYAVLTWAVCRGIPSRGAKLTPVKVLSNEKVDGIHSVPQ